MEFLTSGPDENRHRILLAHGAGAPMDSEFMSAMAEELAAYGFCVMRFEFPYMQKRRDDGKKRPPDSMPVLEQTFVDAVEQAGGPEGLVIGGKSMGGRVASRVADRLKVAGLFCLGYPFHPPGRPEKLRVDHLRSLKSPCLILQGERDPFGGREEVDHFGLGDAITVEFLLDGDHSFKPRKSSGVTEEENLQLAACHVAVHFYEGKLCQR